MAICGVMAGLPGNTCLPTAANSIRPSKFWRISSTVGADVFLVTPATVTTPEPKDPTKNFVKLEAYRQRFPTTKLMISIGGWNHSHTGGGPGIPDPTPLFARIAADPVWRAAFVASALDTFIRRMPRLFDGIDLDWEFPGTSADKANLTLLAKEFRSQLDRQGQLTDERTILDCHRTRGGDRSAIARTVCRLLQCHGV